MSKDQVILDIDNTGTLAPTLHQLIQQPGVWSKLIEDFTHDCAIFHEIAHEPKYVTTDLVCRLRADASNVIRSEYTAVAAYHACLPINYRSYTERGLLRTNRRLLLDLCKEVFWQIPKLDQVFEPVCQKYLEWYDGTVGLFLSAHEDTSWYEGSCFLGKVADALGQEGQDALRCFLARGTPTMVKCRLPLDWLDTKMREPSLDRYASAVLQKMILLRASPDDAHCDFGALGLKADLPSEMIIEFIDVSKQ